MDVHLSVWSFDACKRVQGWRAPLKVIAQKLPEPLEHSFLKHESVFKSLQRGFHGDMAASMLPAVVPHVRVLMGPPQMPHRNRHPQNREPVPSEDVMNMYGGGWTRAFTGQRDLEWLPISGLFLGGSITIVRHEHEMFHCIMHHADIMAMHDVWVQHQAERPRTPLRSCISCGDMLVRRVCMVLYQYSFPPACILPRSFRVHSQYVWCL
jgi:hypothetical protein